MEAEYTSDCAFYRRSFSEIAAFYHPHKYFVNFKRLELRSFQKL